MASHFQSFFKLMSNKTVIPHFHICRSCLNKDIETQLVTIFGKKLKSKVPDWSHKFNYAHKSTLPKCDNLCNLSISFNYLCQLSPV